MQAITVTQLQAIIDDAVRKGLGSKHILISSDDEGNEFHELFYGISDNTKEMFDGPGAPILAAYGVSFEDLDNYVILG